MNFDWIKTAILGSTYARALENRNIAAGRPAGAFASIAAQPLAKLKPGASAFARAPGPLTPTPTQRGMQKMLAKTPWAGEDHDGAPDAEARFNALLRRRGQDVQSPRGDTGAQIAASFGHANQARTGRTVTNAPAPAASQGSTTQGGPDVRDHLARGLKRPNIIAAPDAASGGGVQVTKRPRQDGDAPAHLSPGMLERRLGQARQQAVQALPDRRRPAQDEATGVLKAGSARLKAAGHLWPYALGAAIPLAVGSGLLLNKPGIMADLKDRFSGGGSLEQKDHAQEIPEAVQQQAAQAAAVLQAHGIDPAKLRLAVDAPSGAGKTVLSKAIAGQLGMRHYGLDWRPNMRRHQLLGGRDIEDAPYAPHAGEIVEHQQLLRSYDPELFDAAIHIRKDPATIRAQVLKRGRGARTHDLLDYDKSIAVGGLAFDTLGGDEIDLGGGAYMKLRPQDGWGNHLDQHLRTRGVDPTGLTRHAKLLSLHAGQRTEGAGWLPYAKSPFNDEDKATLAASLPLGVLAARTAAGMMGAPA